MSVCTYRWAKVLQALERQLPPTVFTELFGDLELIRLNEEVLELYTPNPHRRDAIMRFCSQPIQKILKELYGMAPRISFPDSPEEPVFTGPAQLSPKPLCTDYTLDSFLPGNNSTALNLALQVAEHPGELRHNPLVLYGPSGSGKTHLLQGIGNRILQQNPDAKVTYVHCSDYTRDLLDSIIHGRSRSFRLAYHSCDVLLVDDIQFLAGKESTQEEFYYLFNWLYEHGKQIILTSSRPVPEILCMEDRMKACFIGGIMQPLRLPDRRTRRAFLLEYARKQQLELTEEALDFLAVQTPGSFARLRGIVDHLRLQGDAVPFAPDITTVIKTVAKFRPRFSA